MRVVRGKLSLYFWLDRIYVTYCPTRFPHIGIKAFFKKILVGRITKDFYEQKRKEYRDKQDKLTDKIAKLQQTDENFYITTAYLVELASRAGELFRSSEAEEKRQLLSLVLQNLRLEGKKLRYEVQFPFDTILKHAPRSEWLPVLDSFRNGYKSDVLDITSTDIRIFNEGMARLLIKQAQSTCSTQR